MNSWWELATPIGPLLLSSDGQGLSGISFCAGRRPSRPDPEGERSRTPFEKVIEELEAYFAGELTRFEAALSLRGTPFQLEVWSILRTIPYGETTTYGAIARQMGRPEASRAVGAANGRNPIPVIVPCHRVVGSDGSLTGFGGGLPIKKALLALEAERCGASSAAPLLPFDEAAP